MQLKKYILLLDRNMRGAVVPFPYRLEYPPSKSVPGRSEDSSAAERVFDRTDRYKTLDGITAVIYTERGASLDVDSYADPVEHTASTGDQTPAPSTTASVSPSSVDLDSLPITRIYGASDHLVEFDGAFSGKVGWYDGGDEQRSLLLIVSDGTMLQVRYGKGEQAVWAITVIKKGSAYAGFEPCDDEDAEIHSDIVTLRGDIKYAYASHEWERVR